MCLNLFFTSISMYRRDKFHQKKCKHNLLGIKFVLCDFELCQLVSEQLRWKEKWRVCLIGQVVVFYTWPNIWSGPFSDNDIKSLGHTFSVMELLIGSEFVTDFRTWIDKLNLSVFSCFTTYVPFRVYNRGKYGTMGERVMERWRAYRNWNLGLSRATLSYSVLKGTVKVFHWRN
jgi:hypothetical protein